MDVFSSSGLCIKTERKFKLEDKCQLFGEFTELFFLSQFHIHKPVLISFISFSAVAKKRDKDRRDRKDKDLFRIKQKKKKKKKKKSKLHCKLSFGFASGSEVYVLTSFTNNLTFKLIDF